MSTQYPFNGLNNLLDSAKLGDALLHSHRHAPDPHSRASVASEVFSRVLDAEQEPNFQTWGILIQTGFIQKVLHIGLDKHFCGYTKEELTTWPEKLPYYVAYMQVSKNLKIRPALCSQLHYTQTSYPPQPHIVMICNIICSCCKLLEACRSSNYRRIPAPRAKIASTAELILQETAKIWSRIWEIKTPFLDSQPKVAGPMDAHPNQIYLILLEWALRTFNVEKELQYVLRLFFAHQADMRIRDMRKMTIYDPSCRMGHV